MSTGIVIPWIVIGKFVTSPKGRFLSPCTLDRKSTRLNSSHSQISYAVFCLKKKKIVRFYNVIIPVYSSQSTALTHHILPTPSRSILPLIETSPNYEHQCTSVTTFF